MVQPKKPLKPRPTNLFVAFLQMFGIMYLRCPIWLRLWLVCLMGTNLIGFTVLDTIEGQVVVGLMPLIGFPMAYLYQKYGFVKLLGLPHFWWFLLVPWIVLYRLPLAEDGSFHQKWMQILAIPNSISLVLDVKDVYEYCVLGKTESSFEW